LCDFFCRSACGIIVVVLQIGNVSLPSSCVLAPLAGVSDLPFRLISRSCGCGFAHTEMISARSLVYQSANTLKMLSIVPEDRPLGVQLLGSDPEVLRNALDLLAGYRFDIVDFNAACPVGKVVGKGEGASLLREPGKLGALLKVIVENASAPVTVKIRAGWDDASVTAREAVLRAEDAGVAAVCIHGRTRAQGYGGRVDYSIIRRVKEAVKIPVIASGDALSPLLIKKLFDETGCNGVAIARGSLGNPWIFRETAEFLRNGTLPERPSVVEIAEKMKEHFDLCCDFHGEHGGTKLFRKFFAWYSRGISDVRPLRQRAFTARTKEEMTGLIRELGERKRMAAEEALYHSFPLE
jgi:tRNA-dihydrouridine synthase B